MKVCLNIHWDNAKDDSCEKIFAESGDTIEKRLLAYVLKPAFNYAYKDEYHLENFGWYDTYDDDAPPSITNTSSLRQRQLRGEGDHQQQQQQQKKRRRRLQGTGGGSGAGTGSCTGPTCGNYDDDLDGDRRIMLSIEDGNIHMPNNKDDENVHDNDEEDDEDERRRRLSGSSSDNNNNNNDNKKDFSYVFGQFMKMYEDSFGDFQGCDVFDGLEAKFIQCPDNLDFDEDDYGWDGYTYFDKVNSTDGTISYESKFAPATTTLTPQSSGGGGERRHLDD